MVELGADVKFVEKKDANAHLTHDQNYVEHQHCNKHFAFIISFLISFSIYTCETNLIDRKGTVR